ncbi:MAG TPA: Vms1/Ankzf1 family peptidyl-tRNA hydrolase [Roseiflexaceae bacterium]|nr:Vms1/Ankzf1 family peptidyl-tRNA hydrolase [Roseiflexaceae bacterium]
MPNGTNLHSVLQELTAYPNADHPFLSIYLDWAPDGNGKRPTLRVLEDELAAHADRMAGDAAHRAGFETDRQRILDYLNREAPRDARALAIFACHGQGIWQALPLQAPVETSIAVDRYPHTFELARLIDEHETCALVLAEGQEARILVIGLDDAEQVAETEASEKIKRFDQGGQAQMLFQRRTDNLIKAHTKDIAEQLEKVIAQHDVRHVIIAGNDSIKGMIMDSLTDPITARLIEYIHLDPNSDMKTILETVEPMVQEAERRQEAELLAELEKHMTAKGGLGTLGVAETALALSKGQVQTLLMLRGFSGTGGECVNCGMLRAGQRDKCPYDGADMRPIELREAFTARAIQQSADIQIVEANDYLAEHEGVGALLRYRDEERSKTVAG